MAAAPRLPLCESRPLRLSNSIFFPSVLGQLIKRDFALGLLLFNIRTLSLFHRALAGVLIYALMLLNAEHWLVCLEFF
ncbi:hypothetical protein RHMOL_Rhmol10G0177500 [Rhododendron molle]|uniref:Uncharacterized protein n=1 Tax=Rhododendron molle TaxID=49168 RepID=A0ACC0M4Z6_RHOML|nr:hypothetical protein RHMOL_Rhmol10G0177500 [Rhododendron molle]